MDDNNISERYKLQGRFKAWNITNKNEALIVLDANRTASKCVANFTLNEKLDLKTLRNITATLRNFN